MPTPVGRDARSFPGGGDSKKGPPVRWSVLWSLFGVCHCGHLPFAAMAMGGHDSFWGNGFLAHIAVIQRLPDSVLLLPGRAFDPAAGGSGQRNQAGWMGVDHLGRDLGPNQAPSVRRSSEKETRS